MSIQGKHPCWPKEKVKFKCPWALTCKPMIDSKHSCMYVYNKYYVPALSLSSSSSLLLTSAAMLILVEIVRQEAGGDSTQTTEQQIRNFIGQALSELGLYRWLTGHGGWVSESAVMLVKSS